jgi:predicted small lipoprotein YifL
MIAVASCWRGDPVTLGYTAGVFRGNPAMHRSLLLLPFCLATAALAGCGNKGPLYLPARPAPATTAPVPASAATLAAPAAPAPADATPASH